MNKIVALIQFLVVLLFVYSEDTDLHVLILQAVTWLKVSVQSISSGVFVVSYI